MIVNGHEHGGKSAEIRFALEYGLFGGAQIDRKQRVDQIIGNDICGIADITDRREILIRGKVIQ